MADGYDEAAAILYQASFAEFVAERKRLAGELKAAGDKSGALRLGKLTRPSIAAWAVNQLWWHARADFEALFAAGQRLREGDLSGTDARREAIGRLRERATALLAAARQGASEATLRRIATTLSALAAQGGFAPDAPGQLSADRDPPGFESAAIIEGTPRPPPWTPSPRPPSTARPMSPPRPRELEEARRQRELREKQRREEEAARARAAAEDRRRMDEERARQHAERQRLERSLRGLQSEIERRARDVERLRSELGEAEAALDKSRTTAREIEARLAALRRE